MTVVNELPRREQFTGRAEREEFKSEMILKLTAMIRRGSVAVTRESFWQGRDRGGVDPLFGAGTVWVPAFRSEKSCLTMT